MDIHECKMLDHNAHFSYGFLLCLMDILIDSQRNLKIIFLPPLPALHLVSWLCSVIIISYFLHCSTLAEYVMNYSSCHR